MILMCQRSYQGHISDVKRSLGGIITREMYPGRLCDFVYFLLLDCLVLPGSKPVTNPSLPENPIKTNVILCMICSLENGTQINTEKHR